MGSGHRQHLLDATCYALRWSARIAVGVLGPGAAHGQDCWIPDPWFPRSAPSATGTFAAAIGGEWAAGYVPPFRAGARDRGSIGVDAIVGLAPFLVRARWEWLADVTAVDTVSGPGDLRLGTVASIWRPGPFDVTLGWEAKLPNASDAGELGTDETDALFGASLGYARGPVAARLGVGLAILGNPLRFANQDDVPLVRADASWGRGPFALVGEAWADLPTSRNPPRAGGDLGVRYGTSWFGVARGGGGFSAAAADWRVGLSVGYAGTLPERRSGA